MKARVKSWRDIKNHSNVLNDYIVNPCGCIISRKTEKEILGHKNKQGYKWVSLKTRNGRVQCSVQRLVLAVFKGDRPDRQANHINGNKLDNRIDNLEWVTASENIKHAYDSGLMPRGRWRKFSEKDVLKIVELLKSGLTQKQVADMYGVSQTAINKRISRSNILIEGQSLSGKRRCSLCGKFRSSFQFSKNEDLLCVICKKK